ncbi:MAG: hypothetical protein PVJ42_05450 [bacterium]|jgi:hypothetical protein
MRLATYVLIAVLVISAFAARASAGDRSLSRAMLYSLLVPGTGELYMGYKTQAKVHLAGEAAVWAGFAYFRYQGGMREDTYKELAEINAGVDGEKDDDYYQAIAYYISNEVYNVDILREARFYYDSREQQLEYWENNGYFDEDAWEWRSIAAMDEYRDVRTESRKSYRRSTLMVGFAVLNRMISLVGLYVTTKSGEQHAGMLPRVSYDDSNGGSTYLYLNLPIGK